jgi:hypothetical protein
MVAKQIFHAHGVGDDILSHRNAIHTSEIILCDFIGRVVEFIVTTDEQRDHTNSKIQSCTTEFESNKMVDTIPVNPSSNHTKPTVEITHNPVDSMGGEVNVNVITINELINVMNPNERNK